jgi:hypothetical protein
MPFRDPVMLFFETPGNTQTGSQSRSAIEPCMVEDVHFEVHV